jgi:gas vesicle protein
MNFKTVIVGIITTMSYWGPIVGTAIGIDATVGLLTAPDSGKKTRKKQKNYQKYIKECRRTFEEF